MGQIVVKNQTAPSTPTTGYSSIYIDTADGHLKKKDESGTVVDIEGASGTVTSVTGSSPLQSSGGATPNISFIDQAANRVLAGPTTGIDAAPTFRALVVADIPALDAYWKVAGNAGTSGAKLGTTDAQAWTTIANNITVETYATNGSIDSILNVAPADGVSRIQDRKQINLGPTVSTTTANDTVGVFTLNYDGANDGYDYAGNLVGVDISSNHIGSGTVAYLVGTSSTVSNQGTGTSSFMSNYNANASFANSSTTSLFKGFNMDSQVSSGATITNYNGVGSYLSSTGGIINDARSIDATMGLSGVTVSGFLTGINSSPQVSGASTITGGIYGINISPSISGTSTSNSISGINSYVSANTSAAITNGVLGADIGATIEDAATCGYLQGANIQIQANDTAAVTGSISSLNLGATVEVGASASSFSGINQTANIDGTISNIYGIISSIAQQGTAVSSNLTGFNLNPQLNNTAETDNYTGLNVNPQVNNTAVVNNGLIALSVFPQATPTLPDVTGVKIDMSAVSLSPASLAAGNLKTAINVNDGAFISGYNYTIPGAVSFFQTNYLGGGAIVASGDPISAFGFGNNLAHSVILHDDWSIDGSGLGFVDVGFVGSLAFDTGTTMAKWTGALGGAGNPSGAGTLTDAIMFRAGGILPQGGSLTVTNMYGFQVDPNLFGLVGSNVWGFYEDTSAAENHLSKLAIGTSTKKVASTSTALEIGNTKAFLNGRGTTTEKNALTAAAGMQFYDTTLNELQYYNGASWVGTTTAPTLTAGSIAFSNGTTLAQDNANLFWDDANNRLGIGTNTPTHQFTFQSLANDYANSLVFKPVSGAAYRMYFENGTVLFSNLNETYFSLAFGNTGLMGVGRTPDAAQLHVQSNLTTLVSQKISALSSQTADLIQLLDSSNNVLSYANVSGEFTAPKFTARTSLIIEDPGAGTNKITIQAPTLAGDYTITLPVDDGTTGQVLSTNGSGVTSWITPSAGSGISSVATKTANYTLTGSDDVILADGNFTLTLPAASTVKQFYIKNITGGTCTIVPDGSDTIDGSTSLIISSIYSAVQLISDGVDGWHVF